MKQLAKLCASLSAFLVCFGAVAQQTSRSGLSVLYNFPGAPGTPVSFSEGVPGVFYGSTVNIGGPGGSGGTVFSVTNAGAFHITHQFPVYSAGYAVLRTLNGDLFGLAIQSTSLEFFSMNLSGGAYRQYLAGTDNTIADLFVPAPSGELYFVEGPSQSSASIVRIDLQGRIQTVHSFTPAEGQPSYNSNLLLDGMGNLYGMNTDQKTSVWIYRLSPTGVFTKLATFTIQAAGSITALVLGPDGVIYGTLLYSGPSKLGSIYRLTPDGTVTTLANFPFEGMGGPASLIMADDGNLYGTTYQLPSYIFRYDLAAGKLERLYQLSALEGECTCIMVQGSDGKFYAAAPGGGSGGFGTIFSFDALLPPPKPRVSVLRPDSGAVGARVLLWGSNLLGATSVTFNGTPATNVMSTSVNSVYVDVPAGATSGPVTVTTPNGSFTTTGNFTVE